MPWIAKYHETGFFRPRSWWVVDTRMQGNDIRNGP
jgi:hypothetical protein